MVSITQKYAPIVFVFAIAFLMIAPLQVIDVFAAIPSTMSVAGNNIQVQSYDDRKVTLTWTPVAVPGVGFYDYELQVGSDCVASIQTYSDPHSIATIGSFYNLTPDTTYYFRLAAVNASGAGTMSDCISQKTLAAESGGQIGTSPTPRTPYGCRGLRTSTIMVSIIGMSREVGMR